ncbi:MAG: DUF115 domain-containing protein [Desulfobacterales bacterium]|nr:DUF115 domain-containing protein [Desulfobacterales bacterium]
MKSNLPNFYDLNLSLLKKMHPHVWKIMIESTSEPTGEVFISPNGKPNLRGLNKEGKVINFHNESDPEADAYKFLEMVPEHSTGFVGLLGMGLGYEALALLQQRPSIRHLVVFERMPGIFKQALHLMDLSPLLLDPRLILSVNAEPEIEKILAPANRALQLETIHILNHLPSFFYDMKGCQALKDKVFDYVNKYNVGGATTFKFGSHFLDNRFSHLKSIHHNYLLESLRGAFSGIPAIIVAGGPSLDRNIHLLPTAKDKAVIIGVDTVLPAMLAQGILPEFITSIDPQELTYEKFADVIPMTKGVSLICAAWVTPKVPKLFPAEHVFWTFSGNPMENWLSTLLGGKILTGGAGTVAHLNLISAIILGCSPIIFVGQDLAFSDFKDHAQNTVLSNENQMNNMLKSDADILWVEGIHGRRVPTSRSFYSDKQHFEKIMAENSGHYINATEGGVHLQGTESLSLEKVLDLYCSKPHNISGHIVFCLQNFKLSDNKKLFIEFQTTLKKVRNLNKVIQKADYLTYTLRKGLLKYEANGEKYRSLSTLPRPMQEKIKKIDTFHNKLDSEKKIWQILEEITMEGLRESERRLLVINKLEGVPEKYVEWLSKNLERLEDINKVRKKVLEVFETHLCKTLAHHEKEKNIKKDLEKGYRPDEDSLRLACFYFESGEFVLAKPMLEKLLNTGLVSAQVYFFLGTIEAYQTDYQKAEKYFKKAIQLNPSYIKSIKNLRQKLGDQYLCYVKCNSFDKRTSKRMFIKGLRYCPDHIKIKDELKAMAADDLKKIKSVLETGSSKDIDTLIKAWYKDLEENKILSTCLSTEQLSEFYCCYGKFFTVEKKFTKAINTYKKALIYSPNNPQLHIFVADTYFAQGDFSSGIKHLNEAVTLDRSYAKYWEHIGDNLRRAGQDSDAVYAYEQSFIVLPEKISLIKKIGDCYLTLGKLEAAYEAYRQFKFKLEIDSSQIKLTE